MATGKPSVTGALAGTVVPSGFVGLQPNINFQTLATSPWTAAATATFSLQAVLPQTDSDGTSGTAAPGPPCRSVSRNRRGAGHGSVVADISNGAGPETNEAFVARYIDLYRSRRRAAICSIISNGALEVPGVTRACATIGDGHPQPSSSIRCSMSRNQLQRVPQGTNGVATGETRGTAATGDH